MNTKHDGKYPLFDDNDSAEFFGDLMNDLSDHIEEEDLNLNYIKEYFETKTRKTNVCCRYVNLISNEHFHHPVLFVLMRVLLFFISR